MFEKIMVALLFIGLMGVVEYQGRVIASQRRIVAAAAVDSMNLAKCQGELNRLRNAPKVQPPAKSTPVPAKPAPKVHPQAKMPQLPAGPNEYPADPAAVRARAQWRL